MVSRKTVVAHEPLPAAALVPARRGRRAASTPTSSPVTPSSAPPRCAATSWRSATRAAPTRATTSTPASTASAASSTAPRGRRSRSSASATWAAPSSPTSQGKSPSVAIVAAFDDDPALADTVVHGVRCFDAARMEDLVRDLGIEIAVLTVPGAARPGRRRRARARGRQEHHQLRPRAAAPAQRHLRRVHGHHGGARVGRVLRPPRRPTRTRGRDGAGEIEPMVKKLEIAACEVEHETRGPGGAHRRPHRHARRRRAAPRSPRSTPATASATCSTRPPTRRCW